MPLDTPTVPVGPTQVDNNTVNVLLERRARFANQPRNVGTEIAYINPIMNPGNSYVRRINERSALSGVNTFAVGDNAPESRSTLTPTTITGALRGLRTYIRDDADLVSIENEIMVNDEQLRRAWARYWSLQVLALFSSVNASTGTAATTFDLTNWDSVTSLFRLDGHPDGMLWAVLHGDAVRDLKASIRSSGSAVFGSMFGERKADALAASTNGLGVPFEDYMLYEANEVPAGDTTGWTNCLGVKADERDSGIVVDVHLESRVRYQRDESSVGGVQVISGISGAGIAAQGSLRAAISRT